MSQPTGRRTPGSALVPVPTAADLAGVTVENVLAWIADGVVYAERIRHNVYASLDDVTAMAGRSGAGGGGQS